MAYTKTPAAGAPSTEPAKIAFSYVKDTLFDMVSMRSTFMTKSMRNERGETIGEDYALSADERMAFESALKVVMSEVFEIFKKHTHGITDSYKITETDVVVTINDHNAYNTNDLDLVDMAIEDAIIDGCLQGWFSLRAEGNLAKFTGDNYARDKEALKSRLFSLKIRRAFVSSLNNS